MKIQEKVPLASYTTFRIGGPARFFLTIESAFKSDIEKELSEALDFARSKNLPVFVLGGGSNLLISDKGVEALVIKFESSEKKEIKFGSGVDARAGASEIILEAGAGENWDDVVSFAVEHGFGGIENLSLIPGSTGAAAAQNIGAYGKEISQVIEWVEAFDMHSKKIVRLGSEDCDFSYRMSIFKKEEKRFIIIKIALRLSKNAEPNVSYKDVEEYFKNHPVSGKPSIADVRRAVMEIRTKKLPDPAIVPNAGSFFKNPIIKREEAEILKKKFPGLPVWSMDTPDNNDFVKVSAAWIIDHVCGLKGATSGNVSTHERQPLVIINRGQASADEIKKFADMIVDTVKRKTGIILEREVEYVGEKN